MSNRKQWRRGLPRMRVERSVYQRLRRYLRSDRRIRQLENKIERQASRDATRRLYDEATTKEGM